MIIRNQANHRLLFAYNDYNFKRFEFYFLLYRWNNLWTNHMADQEEEKPQTAFST